MIIRLPNNGVIDTDNITPDFEGIVKKSFAGYTAGTKKEFMHHDKLSYLDSIRRKMHGVDYTNNAVCELLKEKFAYGLDEFGEITDKDDFFCIEFMEECFDKGFLPMYSYEYSSDRRESEKIMQVLFDIIKIVLNYDGE